MPKKTPPPPTPSGIMGVRLDPEDRERLALVCRRLGGTSGGDTIRRLIEAAACAPTALLADLIGHAARSRVSDV